MESIGTKAFMQICLVVKDAEETMKNFMEVFGVEKGTLKYIPEPETFRTIYRGKQIKTKTKYYVFKMGEMTIELTEPDEVPSVWKEIFDDQGQGLCYLGVMVPGFRQRPSKPSRRQATPASTTAATRNPTTTSWIAGSLSAST